MTNILDFFSTSVGIINNHLSYVLIIVLLFASIYFSLRLGFIQIRHFRHMFSALHNSREKDQEGISSYQAFCTSMAARVGTGNVAGIAIAITLGGPGAIFWMWLIAIFGAATAFAESTLAQMFKCKDAYGHFRGGPAYYMQQGLNSKWMGILFSIFLILCYGFAFIAVQANTVASLMHDSLHIAKWQVGVLIVFLTVLVIFGGMRRIARVAGYVVPPMAGIYIISAFILIGANVSRIPEVFTLIYHSAFGLKEFTAGGIGIAIMNGIKRGLFSNEAGMGSAPNIAAAATPYPPHPASQGYVQMAGVIIDTLIICTSSAAIILLSGIPLHGETGILLIQKGLETQYGSWSKYFLTLIILFFGFAAIIGDYTYAENCFLFLKKRSGNPLVVFRVAVCGAVFLGAVVSLPLVWAMADIAMSFMALTNLIAILLLSGIVVKLSKDYNRQLRNNEVPTFNIKQFPEIRAKISPGVWGKD